MKPPANRQIVCCPPRASLDPFGSKLKGPEWTDARRCSWVETFGANFEQRVDQERCEGGREQDERGARDMSASATSTANRRVRSKDASILSTLLTVQVPSREESPPRLPGFRGPLQRVFLGDGESPGKRAGCGHPLTVAAPAAHTSPQVSHASCPAPVAIGSRRQAVQRHFQVAQTRPRTVPLCSRQGASAKRLRRSPAP